MSTIQIRSIDEASQGPFVVINLADFDPAKHEPFDQASEDAIRAASPEQLTAAVTGVRAEFERRDAAQREEAARLAAESERLEALAKSLQQPAAAPAEQAAPATDGAPAALTPKSKK